MLDYIKSLCSKYALVPKSWQGQNFLIDQKVLDRIISVSGLKKEDIILEVGPGFGILTKELAKRVKKVITVEIEEKLVKALKNILKDYKNVEIMQGDILKISNVQFLIPNYKIVANIPYSITAHFLRKFLEGDAKPQEMILLVQKEVAERIIAKNKDASLLSVSVQFYGQPEIIDFVSSSSFYPEPEVDSAIIKIGKIGKGFSQNLSPEEIKSFFRIVKIGFSSRRKQLHNNLSAGLRLESEKIKEIFGNLGFNQQIRAQELSIEDWVRLAKEINSKKY